VYGGFSMSLKVKYSKEIGFVIQLKKIAQKLGDVVIWSDKHSKEIEVSKNFFYRKCVAYNGNTQTIIERYLNRVR